MWVGAYGAECAPGAGGGSAQRAQGWVGGPRAKRARVGGWAAKKVREWA